MRLEGCVALVTGAGSGIGRAIAVELSRRGASTILLGRREGTLEETRASLAAPEASWILPLDLADGAARAEIAEHVQRMSGALDLLINNAGVVEAGAFAEQDGTAWRRMLEINLLAPITITGKLLPLLRASGQGRVVNVGSMFGDIAFPHFAAYSASKFGLRGWSEALRREWQPYGIGVTYCAPRGTRTPAADGFMPYALAYRMRLDTPETTARQIVAGIVRGRRDIYPSGIERFYLLLQRLWPGRIDRALQRMQNRVSGLLRRPEKRRTEDMA